VILDGERLLDLADLVLENLEDWREELAIAEPSRGGSWITLTTGSRGGTSRPVESFVMRRDDLEATLRAVERRLKRMNPHLRKVYRAVWRNPLGDKRLVIAERIGCHEKTLARDIRRIRSMVAGTLANLGPGRLRGLLGA